MDADARIRLRLSVMMALVYAVQGAFWPILSIHLGDLGISERSRGWIFATFAIASFAMPLGAGQLVDRSMPTQWFLALSFASGSVLLAAIAGGFGSSATSLFGLFLVYWLLMAPSYSLSNSLAFRNLRRPDRDFAGVRLWGTVGWMVVGWVVSLAMGWTSSGHPSKQGATEAFWIASALSMVTAAYCLTLPATPPVKLDPGGRQSSLFSDVRDLVRVPGVRVYLIAAFFVSLTTPFVYQVMPHYLRTIGMDRAWVASAMSLGQWPEIISLVFLPILIRRWGYRITLVLGVGAYAVRFGMLVLEPRLWVATAGIPLHGVGVACFSIVGQMFLNSRASADRRATTQSINTVINGGLGSMTGSLLAGEVVRWSPIRPGMIFLLPCLIHSALVVFLLIKFRPNDFQSRTNPLLSDPKSRPRKLSVVGVDD